MKKLFLVFLVLSIMIVPLMQAQASLFGNDSSGTDIYTPHAPDPKGPVTDPELWEPARPATIKSTKDFVSVHDCNKKGMPVVDTIANGTLVNLVEFSPDGKWYRVTYDIDRKGGYVLCSDLEF